MNTIRKVDISHKTIFFLTAFLVGLWVTFLIRELLIILFLALILMSAISPIISFFANLKVPKSLSIGITYLIIVSVFIMMALTVTQPLIEQSNRMISRFPDLAKQVLGVFQLDESVIQSQVGSISQNLLSITFTVFDNILTIIFLLVITFYLLLEKEELERRIAKLFIGREEKTRILLGQIEEKLGSWLRGQLILSLIIGLLSYIGLLVLNIPYALPLALLAGVMEIIPVIGPIVSAIPAILVGYSISPILGLIVGIMYLVIQQLENHLIVPQVMKRAVGLNPLVVILAIAIGGKILGFAGALLAVPMAVVVQIIASEILSERQT